jgi:hypothetical protein
MCHQSVGLIQNAIESAGIATVLVTMKPEITVHVGSPRALWVRFPLGNPCGEPFRADQQRKVLLGALAVFEEASTAGELFELAYRWRRF